MTAAQMPAAVGFSGLSRLVRGRWGLGTLIVAAAVAAYSNSLGGAFIFDDLDSILDNATIHQSWPIGPVLSPPSAGGRTVAGRPVVNLSLAVNYVLSGTQVWSYHALNLVIHVLASLTLWGIVRRTLRLELVPQRIRASADGLAFAVALLWAVHPLTTAAVTYVVQRAESLMALFYLLTLYCVIRAWDSPRRLWWSAGAVAVAAFGMATKEVMATAPLVVLLYDRTFLSRSFVRALRRRWGLYAGLLATCGLLVALAGGRAASAGFAGPVRTGQYALTQLHFVAHYLRLSFWPHPLVFDYGTPLVRSVREVLPEGLLVTALLLATVIALRVRPWLGFLGAWCFLILAPSSSIVPVSTQTGAEHRMYLPLAAVVALTVLTGHWLWSTGAGRLLSQSTWRARTGGLLVVVVAGVLAALTFQRNEDYRSGISIWTDTVAKRPDNPRAHYNLGRHLVDAGEFSRAQEEFLLAVQRQPDYPDAYMNLGCIRARLGQHEEAIADFDRAIEVAPRKAENYFNRATAYFALGRYEQSIADCDATIARDGRHAQAYYERGLAQQKLMQTAQAVASYTVALQLKPDYAAAFGERAISYYFLKRYDAAWADVRAFRHLGGTPNPEFLARLTRASGRTEP